MTTRDMVEVSSVVGDDATGDGSREHPFATLERASQVAALIEVVEGQRPVIVYDGLLGTMVPAQSQVAPDGNPLVGTAWLLAIFSGSWLAAAALVASGFLFWTHPRAFLVAVVVAVVILLGLLVPASQTADPELDEIDRGAL